MNCIVSNLSFPEIHFIFEKPDLNEICRREWLETNGLGGFASSTLCGMNTRKYHGLLMAALQPPVQRILFLSKLDETLTTDDGDTELGTNQYPGVFSPQGYRFLHSFHLDPFPRFIYRVGEYELEKIIFMPYEKNAVAIRYKLKKCNINNDSSDVRESVLLKVRPFLAFRQEHHNMKKNSNFATDTAVNSNSISWNPYPSLPALTVYYNGWRYKESPDWYNNFEYQHEMERGLDYREDLFSPGEVVHDFINGAGYILATIETGTQQQNGMEEILPIEKFIEMLLEKELNRREKLLRGFDKFSPSVRRRV
ncbi:MAG: glycogen debranching enzyme N-terminal domain-containing protein, partial [bacterium]